jgi:hypothetical protein
VKVTGTGATLLLTGATGLLGLLLVLSVLLVVPTAAAAAVPVWLLPAWGLGPADRRLVLLVVRKGSSAVLRVPEAALSSSVVNAWQASTAWPAGDAVRCSKAPLLSLLPLPLSLTPHSDTSAPLVSTALLGHQPLP